jgi:putative MATE family efflux protein
VPPLTAVFDETDRRLLRLAWPAFLTLSVEPVYVLVDNAIVGHISTQALGGLALAGTVLSTLSWLIGFLATGITTQVAQRLGADDRQGAQDAVSQGLIVALGLGLLGALIAGLGAAPLCRLVGGKGVVLSAATTYLRISAFGLPALALAFLATGWFRGSENLRIPVRVIFGANIANVVLEVLFVWVFHWGIAGSALGTVLVQWASVGIYVIALSGVIHLQRVRADAIRALLKIGGAMLIRTSLMVTTISAATWLASRQGDTALGAHQIGVQIYFFLALIVDALAVSSQSVFASQMGSTTTANSSGDMWPIVRRLIRLGLIAGIALGVLLALVSPFLGRIISSDRSVLHQSVGVLLWCALMQISGAIVFVLDGVLMGANLFRYLAIGAFVAAAVFWLSTAFMEYGPPRTGASGLMFIWISLNAWMASRMLGNLLIARRFLRRSGCKNQT